MWIEVFNREYLLNRRFEGKFKISIAIGVMPIVEKDPA
jgi:hypothetical protein